MKSSVLSRYTHNVKIISKFDRTARSGFSPIDPPPQANRDPPRACLLHTFFTTTPSYITQKNLAVVATCHNLFDSIACPEPRKLQKLTCSEMALFRWFHFQRTLKSRPLPDATSMRTTGLRLGSIFAGGALLSTAYMGLPGRPHVVECAPAKLKTYSTSLFTPRSGPIPIPALMMLKQIQEPFARDFPDWELPATFTQQLDYFYEELGPFRLLWPEGAFIRVPIFPRMTDAEERALAETGQRKQPVATCYVRCACKAACAEIQVMEVKILDAATDKVLWSWLNQ